MMRPIMKKLLDGLQTINASDGTSIAYRIVRADRDRPVVGLVHSLAMDNRFWDPVISGLADVATVVVVDARGHGRSGRGALPYTTERMALDLRDVLDHLRIDKIVVGGASMGGCVALTFAGCHADRTKGLALIDTTAWYGPSAKNDWEERAQKATAEGLSSLVGFQLSRWFSDSFRARDPDTVNACVETFLANDIEAYAATCRMLGAFDGRRFLSMISVPTRILVGEEDYAAPVTMAEAMHDGISGSSLQIIPCARHLTPLEVPAIVTAELQALLFGSPR